MSEDEQRARDEAGLAALEEWEAHNRDAIVSGGGPLGRTMRATTDTVTDAVNQMTVFIVVRAASLEAAARLLMDHPHMTVFPCHAVEVMPVLGADTDDEGRPTQSD
ncbi:hypothetical protein [Devosia sp.]|uniref:hypothetical protein n=1 Tax=Devosia sp. TaxID=1871048 RepID=UPI003A8F83A6